MLLALALFSARSQAQKPIEGQYIVVFKEDKVKPVIKDQKKNTNREAKANANKPAREQVGAKMKATRAKNNVSENSVIYEYADVLAGFTAKLTPAQKKALEADADVAGVYQDFEVALGPIAQEAAPSDVNVASQYSSSCAITKAGGFTSGSSKATWIWILDTGMDMDHPDLNVQTSSFYAKSFISGQTVEDGHGHGTHVAGIAAAKDNTIGAVGVSAGAKVVPVKVLSNTGSGSWSALIAGLNHVAQYDIANDVVNMSLGGYGYSNCENANPTLRDAIRNLGAAGTYVVMAAGNDSGDANRNLPGCVNGSKVYTVGALNCNNSCASYSNWGSSVDWIAVGSGVYSTYKNGGYATLSGTSMASPVVAGVIHARVGPPVSAGTVSCGGTSFKIAKR